jgi:hypothetical protein
MTARSSRSLGCTSADCAAMYSSTVAKPGMQ